MAVDLLRQLDDRLLALGGGKGQIRLEANSP